MYTLSRHLTKSGKQSPNWNVIDVHGEMVTRCTSRKQAQSLLEALNLVNQPIKNDTQFNRQTDTYDRTEQIQLPDESIDLNSSTAIDLSGERESSRPHSFADCFVDLEDPGDALEYSKAQTERLNSFVERCRKENPKPSVPFPRFFSEFVENVERTGDRMHGVCLEQGQLVREQGQLVREQGQNVRKACGIAEIAIRVAESLAGVDVGESFSRDSDPVSGSDEHLRMIREVE